jgi:DNA-binding MarR family transcriptional regulator
MPFDPVERGYSALNLYDRPVAFQLGYWMLFAEAARIAAYVRRLRSLGLSKATSQYLTLRDLYFSPDHVMTQREIVKRRAVSSPNVTRWINGLERDGLVTRSIDPQNRRTTFVRLTPEGEKLCEMLVPEIAHFVMDFATCLTDSEAELMVQLLQRLYEHAETMPARYGEHDASRLPGHEPPK